MKSLVIFNDLFVLQNYNLISLEPSCVGMLWEKQQMTTIRCNRTKCKIRNCFGNGIFLIINNKLRVNIGLNSKFVTIIPTRVCKTIH